MMKINYWIKLPYDDVMIRPLQPPFEFLVNEVKKLRYEKREVGSSPARMVLPK